MESKAPTRQEIRQQSYLLNSFYNLSKALEFEFLTNEDQEKIMEIQNLFQFYILHFLTAETKRIFRLYGGKDAK